jgi:hypothetical protein
MPRERDPLSLQYDAWSVARLAQMRGDPFGWYMSRVVSPPGDPVDARGLTAHERAAQRSLYYQINYSPSVGRWVKNTDWSLQVEWGEPVYSGIGRFFGRGERRRQMFRRVVPGNSASRAARSKPQVAYTLHPELRADALNL